MNLMVSEKAKEELTRAVGERQTEEGPQTVRVMVASQCGCGAAHFAMGFDEPQNDDQRLELGGVTIVVDPASEPFLEGAEMDYVDELVGRGFRINSPAGGCGCGGHHH